MGENIGDLSGLAQAYRAYRISLNGKEAPVIDGLTGDQRFFMGFAQIWRGKIRDDALRQQLLTNPHSPGDYRAFVPLVNNDAFETTFNVQAGRQDVSRARGPCEDLVGHQLRRQRRRPNGRRFYFTQRGSQPFARYHSTVDSMPGPIDIDDL